jgi:hypothetical protein
MEPYDLLEQLVRAVASGDEEAALFMPTYTRWLSEQSSAALPEPEN